MSRSRLRTIFSSLNTFQNYVKETLFDSLKTFDVEWPCTCTTNLFSTRKKKSWSFSFTSSQYQQDEEVWSPGTSGVVT